jgi:hypothetical protein
LPAAHSSRNGLYAIKSAVPEEGHVTSDGQGGFWTKKGHVTSDGRGGYWTKEGHVASDGQGGYWTKDGHITSDGRGGFWVPGKKGCPSIFGH